MRLNIMICDIEYIDVFAFGAVREPDRRPHLLSYSLGRFRDLKMRVTKVCSEHTLLRSKPLKFRGSLSRIVLHLSFFCQKHESTVSTLLAAMATSGPICRLWILHVLQLVGRRQRF
jgi:hypothetical protein